MTKIKKIAQFFLVVTAAALLSFLVFKPEAEAIGISIRPAEVKMKTTSNKPAIGRIVVKNLSSAALLFDVYSDEFEKSIKTMPSSFILEGGGEREVLARADMDGEGLFIAALSITARPLSSREIEAAAGVKVPISIEVERKKNLAALLGVFGESQPRDAFFAVFGMIFMAAVLFGFSSRKQKFL